MTTPPTGEWIGGPFDGASHQLPVVIPMLYFDYEVPVRVRAHDGALVLLWSEVTEKIRSSTS